MFFEHHFKKNEIDRTCGMYGKQERCTDEQTLGDETSSKT
jgi:hypothetical protein